MLGLKLKTNRSPSAECHVSIFGAELAQEIQVTDGLADTLAATLGLQHPGLPMGDHPEIPEQCRMFLPETKSKELFRSLFAGSHLPVKNSKKKYIYIYIIYI